jgi:hypothetical protein
MMNPDIRSILANAVLESAPPLIRKTLLEDQDFRREYSLEADAVLVLGNSGISFQRSDLFEAVRKFFSGTLVEKVTDTNGQIWELINTGEEGELPRPTLSRDNQNFTLPELVELSPDSSTRLQYLQEAAFDVNLPGRVTEFWRNILKDRALLDDEVDLFRCDFRETPIAKMRFIHDEIVSGQINFSTLVPPSRRYFERLVGAYDGSLSIRDYAAGNGRVFLDQLSQWQPYYGFLYSLLQSSHSLISAEITIDHLSDEELHSAFDFLIKHGDKLSQLGAIEVGLRVLPSRPDIEPFILDLAKQIRDDDVEGRMSSFKLLSSLFVFVDGELSRIRLFSTTPPFYRRLAALSQAALIQRVLINTSVDIDKFGISVLNSRADQYYMQSYADMRVEPRWNPDFASAQQIKADFFGRIMLAGKKYEQNITKSELSDLILGTQPGSLHSLIPFFFPYLPGPLEGVLDSQSSLPTEFAAIIEEQLESKEVGPSSFIALVNSALIFHIGTDLADIAAKVLKLGNYRLTKLENKDQLLSILNGLATVAAVSRSKVFADELRILVRRYRRDLEYALSIEETMRICLVASASCAELNEWREYVGDWLTELSLSDLKDDEGEFFLSHLRCLCHVVPELWVTCGRADSALVACNSSSHPT